ncbi:MAG: bifunctional folylpolyglutamate synthase/dihydrofolate synthase [Candidatus Eremiobacteraeota bacterium]|nr:bifunctional folylpolyglutamate synthase/dihydrofolate synthase [Candidatus Eremiobacteraeota bacterium]
MRALLGLLGDPHDRFKSVHVGGTAGKGSTATMCAAILQAAGHKVGLHTKPHLVSVRERVQIDGAPIAEDRFAALLDDMLPAIDRMAQGQWGSPSYFEVIVALAFLCFAREAVDVAVIEVGVGGKLDGTNVIHPLVSVLTNVGYDHVEVLGDTIEAIARDKSGIIKPAVPVITAALRPEALEIIRQTAQAKGAPLTVVQQSASITPLGTTAEYAQRFVVSTPRRDYDLSCPLLGEFQLTNAATAILACECLPRALVPRPDSVSHGLRNLVLAGRMEYFACDPAVVFDIAHNEEKARALAEALASLFAGRPLCFVCAFSEGKDAGAMIGAWRGLCASYIFTTFDVPHRRAASAQAASALAGENAMRAWAIEDPVQAFAAARRAAGPTGVVVVTGSTFLVGALRPAFLNEWSALRAAHV